MTGSSGITGFLVELFQWYSCRKSDKM